MCEIIAFLKSRQKSYDFILAVKVIQNFCFYLLLNVNTDTYDSTNTAHHSKNGCTFLLSRDCGSVVFSNLGIRAFFCDLSSSEKCPAGRQACSYGSCFCLDLLFHLDNPTSSGLEQLHSQQNWHYLWTQLVSSKYYCTECPILDSFCLSSICSSKTLPHTYSLSISVYVSLSWTCINRTTSTVIQYRVIDEYCALRLAQVTSGIRQGSWVKASSCVLYYDRKKETTYKPKAYAMQPSVEKLLLRNWYKTFVAVAWPWPWNTNSAKQLNRECTLTRRRLRMGNIFTIVGHSWIHVGVQH